MRKFFVFLVNAVLFVVLFAFVGWAYLCAVSYLEIIFKTIILISWAIFLIAVLWIGTVVVLYFYVFKRKYGNLTGTALVEYFSKGGVSLKPAGCYFSLIGACVALYFVGLGINHFVFGHYLKEQEKRLEAMGVSLDWRSYYPDIDYNDPENAAPHIEKALREMGKIGIDDEIDELWNMLKDNGGRKVGDLPERVAKISKTLAAVDIMFKEALGRDKWLPGDMRSLRDDEAYAMDFPFLPSQRRYIKWKMLAVASHMQKGNVRAAENELAGVIAYVKLVRQDPTLGGVLMKYFERIAFFEGLMHVVMVAADKEAASRLVKAALAEIPLSLGMSVVIKYTTASNAAMLKAANGTDVWSRVGVLLYFDLFKNWTVYQYLRGMELQRKFFEEPDSERQKVISGEIDKFIRENVTFAAMLAVIGMPQYEMDAEREARVLADRDVTILFAAAVAYKAKHGRYPDALDKLAPAYLKEIPKNPFTGKPYEYVTKDDYVEIITLDDEGKSIGSPVYMGKRPEKKVEGEKNLKK